MMTRTALRKITEESNQRLEKMSMFNQIAVESESRVQTLISARQVPKDLQNRFELLWPGSGQLSFA